MRFRWSIATPDPGGVRRLTETLRIHPLTAQCLINRGYQESESVEAFLQPRLKQLGDPFALPDMEGAVERLWQARAREERILLFGDYDVDGVTSTALLTEVLSALGWKVRPYLPHRLEEGYGLSRAAVLNALAEGPCELLIAVDCGSTAVESIDLLQEKGVEVIVLDHHQVSDPPPRPRALINPQLNVSGGVDYRELCTVGLAFKLAHGLLKRGRNAGEREAHDYDMRPLLDLVALGTIADLVPLRGENRILTSRGLEYLNQTKRPGLAALKETTRNAAQVGVYEVGFQLGPRLNAAGRLEDARDAFELLRTPDGGQADALAARLDKRNRERQEIEQAITREVTARVREKFDPSSDYVIVEDDPSWHVGVVGIVASRVLREFYRPTLIIGGNQESGHGSGRSIEGFDLAAALRHCDDLLIKHGGHAMAAGLTVDPGKVGALRERLNALAREQLTHNQLSPLLQLDGEVALSTLTDPTVTELGSLHPHGEGNPKVTLVARCLKLANEPTRIGREHKHVKFDVTDGRSVRTVVWWGGGGAAWPQGTFDLAFEPQLNEFRDQRNVQLRYLDWRPVDP